MKPLVLIISIFFLFLAVFPCHCLENHTNLLTFNTEPKSSKEGHDHDHQHLADDNCTPFCACSTYHNPSIIKQYDTISLTITKCIKHVSHYNYTTIATLASDFWRPPQI